MSEIVQEGADHRPEMDPLAEMGPSLTQEIGAAAVADLRKRLLDARGIASKWTNELLSDEERHELARQRVEVYRKPDKYKELVGQLYQAAIERIGREMPDGDEGGPAPYDIRQLESMLKDVVFVGINLAPEDSVFLDEDMSAERKKLRELVNTIPGVEGSELGGVTNRLPELVVGMEFRKLGGDELNADVDALLQTMSKYIDVSRREHAD